MSSWEESFYKFLEQHDDIIETYTEQFMRLPYMWKGSIHQYIPDVLIIYKNDKKQIIEIKPKFK